MAEVAGSFVIRADAEAPRTAAPVQLGNSIMLDPTLLERRRISRSHANEGGIHETR